METNKLNYELPAELIAQSPVEKRSESRLLVMRRSDNVISDRSFCDVVEYINAGDCLVLNNTKVLPGRFYGRRDSGAKLEGLFLEETENGWDVMLKNSRKIKPSEKIWLFDTQGNDHIQAVAKPLERGRWLLEVQGNAVEVLDKIGFAPLPPYIKRDATDKRNEFDRERYQTVFAKEQGAVAAPTAGLHFTDELLDELKEKDVKIAYVTLHVGAGTFKPVTVDNLKDHKIHSERYSVDEVNAKIINDTKDQGGKVFAVGTTAVRTLETVAEKKGSDPFNFVQVASGDTQLFIMPGYEFKIVDAMITNFHLPKSTLLALVGAFAGFDEILKAYQHAVEKKYRFYSYGDAMLIL